MVRYLVFLILLCLKISIAQSQSNSSQETLFTQAQNNHKLLYSDLEEAFRGSQRILTESLKRNLQEPELYALLTQCKYYDLKKDFERTIISAKKLMARAKHHNNLVFQSIARIYLFSAYIFSGLEEEALKELKIAESTIGKIPRNDSLTLATKANLYSCYANYYSLRQEYDQRLKYTKLAIKEHQKFPNATQNQKLQNIDNVNLAAAYLEASNIDSAQYFAEKALPYIHLLDVNRIFLNYLTLSRINIKKQDYQKALIFLKQAETNTSNTNHINLLLFFENIIEAHKELNDPENTKIYESKRDSLKLIIFESQNKSLHKILDEKDKLTDNRIFYAFVILFIILVVFIFMTHRKNRILKKQEKASQDYLEKVIVNSNKQIYDNLLNMLKKNDATFMFYFNEILPDFSSKLQNINPNLSQSEIEFCAFLKMKIPTKDIAKYRFIAPKTVQNKKYLIRKKLNIPKEMDIYEWFDSI